MSELEPPLVRRLELRAIVLMVIGLFIPAIFFGWSGVWTLREYRRDLLAERERLATAIAGHVNATLHWSLGDLWALQSGAIPPESAKARLHESLLRSPFLERVFLLEASGAVTWHEPSHAPLPPAEAVASALAEVQRTSRVAFRTLPEDPSSPNLLIVVPLYGSGADGAVAAGAVLDPSRPALASVLGPGKAGERTSVDVVDASGLVLESSHPDRIGRTVQLPAAVPGPPAVAVEETEIVAAAPLSLLPLALVVRQEESELLAPLHAAERRVLVAAPFGLVLVILFAWGAARSLTEPIAVLTSAAERIAGGELSSAIPPLGEDEVGRLGRSLETMRIKLAEDFERERRVQEELEKRVTERTHDLLTLTRELKDRDERRARLLAKFIRAQEEERKRIARELHDETCQTVAALSVAVDAALAMPPDPERRRLGEIKDFAARALAEVHRVIYDLRPSVLDDLGLAAAVRWLGERHLAPVGIAFRCEIAGLDERLPVEVETAVFRVVQEALMNVVRHAGAETVLVQMERSGDRIEIEVEDDGRGFEPASVTTPESSGRGLGLLGIRERVELLGGKVTIDSAPNRGTRVAVSVPVPGGA
ncbi:MAG: ATP-binding protein [Thermoanaerobaculia bacterium]